MEIESKIPHPKVKSEIDFIFASPKSWIRMVILHKYYHGVYVIFIYTYKNGGLLSK